MNGDVDLKGDIRVQGQNDTAELQLPALGFSATHTTTPFYCFDIAEGLSYELQRLCKETDTNMYAMQLSAFGVLLHRYNRSGNIGIRSCDVQNASYKAVLEQELNGEDVFTDRLHYVSEAIANSTAAASSATCEVTFVMSGDDLAATELVHGERIAFVACDGGALQAGIKYNSGFYSEAEIIQLAESYKALLHSIAATPSQKVGALPMLTVPEVSMLAAFNNTLAPYEADKTIFDAFERQAAACPENVALYMGDRSMSYGELNKKANQLAHHLIAAGVRMQDNVALLTHRNFEMIIGMLAIVKCGAAYVPVTPDTPKDRQQYIIKQSAVKYILANIDHELADSSAGVKAVDLRTINCEALPATNPALTIDSRTLAYTIYTSGSTGVPKGVMIEHHSAVNLIAWVNSEFNVTAKDRLLFITSMGFDLSVYDIFGMLAAGGALVIAQKEEVPNIAKVTELLQRFEITFWDSVPSTMDYLTDRLATTNPEYVQTSLRVVFMSGDWIPVPLPEKIRNHFPNANVISLGGATEGTVWSNYYPIGQVQQDWKSIPYGRPITNNSFYILNEQLQPVPTGVIGELFIGGVGVARGYANDTAKTNYSFLPDPFYSHWGGRMYRTGDLGRMLPGGIMEFVGRKDSQIKIRGHRVELGEIEAVIRQCQSVATAIVLLSADKKQLVSYVVPGKYYDRDTVIAHMKKKLPEYMLPGKWVELDRIPLTSNGKTDTKALLNMDADEQPKSEYTAPKNELEKTIQVVWQEVLAEPRIGVNDNFFDLGGQSLLAVELITLVEKAIERTLPVNIIYKCPTIARLAAFIQEHKPEKEYRSLVTVKATGNKTPVYIVHGDGLSISNFHNLADHVDADQPVFSLQPLGLHGTEEPLTNISDIADHYISEIIEHNPTGPYALGGYSFGGYVAIEMKKKLEARGMKVKMLAIFDTNAENAVYKKGGAAALPRKIKRQVPKMLFIAKSICMRPASTLRYQATLFSKKFNNLCYSLGLKERPALSGINKNISKVDETHLRAFMNYQLSPFEDKVYLFKAKSRMYFVDDFKYLGWKSYAKNGVEVYDVPGDHKTMFHHPNVSELAKSLQHALDNC
ncbi:MAG: amino acid adenylation domain-containing protein [Bacteroidota bacterium]